MLLSACQATKTYNAVGGSRADGTVRLAYEVNMFETPVVDEAQGLLLARQRCAVWGYTGAEPFGGTTRQCIASGAGGCNVSLVVKEYQCTGTGNGGLAVIRMNAPVTGQ